MAFEDWSIIAAENAFTPSLNWAEGMSPSDINDNIREMMAQLKRQFAGYRVFSPEQYGAVGDGIVNDDAALKEMTAALVAEGAGIISLRPGSTYIYGTQQAGVGRYLTLNSPIHINNSAVSVIIQMNGAKLKLASGLKFGTFDTATHLPRSPNTMPFVDATKLAELGNAIFIENADLVLIENGRFDLNSAGQVVGGGYGDTGWQAVCYAIYLGQVNGGVVRNCHGSDSLLDIFHSVQTVPNDDHPGFPVLWEGCTGIRAGRNVAGIGGGKNVVVRNCNFQKAGECPNTVVVSSNPASCFDIENESAGPLRDVLLDNNHFVAGAESNTALVADSGDSARIVVRGGVLDGPVWLFKPGCRLEGDVHVRGVLAKLYGGSTQDANTILQNVVVSDNPTLADLSSFGGSIVGTATGAGVQLINTTWNLANKPADFTGMHFAGRNQINWSGGTNISGLADTGTAINLNNTTGDYVEINEATPLANRPATGYMIAATDSTLKQLVVTSPNNKLALYAASVGVGSGYRGSVGREIKHVSAIRFNKQFANDPTVPGSYGFADQFYGNAAPTTGTWKVGDIVWNEAVESGQPMCWGCSTSGSPGIWVAGPLWP